METSSRIDAVLMCAPADVRDAREFVDRYVPVEYTVWITIDVDTENFYDLYPLAMFYLTKNTTDLSQMENLTEQAVKKRNGVGILPILTSKDCVPFFVRCIRPFQTYLKRDSECLINTIKEAKRVYNVQRTNTILSN